MIGKHKAARNSKQSLSFFEVALARTRWAISDWLILRGLKKPKGKRVLALPAVKEPEEEDDPLVWGGKWADRPIFPRDADITVYWPDVRPCFEDEQDDMKPSRKGKIPAPVRGNKVEQFLGRTAPSPALMTIEVRRKLIETGALNPSRIRASNCS